MNDYYVLVKPWGVYVKESDFFEAQGGLLKPWGAEWKKLQAASIKEAREKGRKIYGSC